MKTQDEIEGRNSKTFTFVHIFYIGPRIGLPCHWYIAVALKTAQARIQEFSPGGGGSNLLKIFDKQEKKNPTERGEGGGLQYLFCFSMVVDIPRCFLQANKTLSRWLFKLCKIGKCVIYVTVGGGPLPEFFWFKWCKIVCLRQNKHRNGTCVKACDSVHDGWTDNHFELASDSNFSNIYTMYYTGERSEPEKNYKNKIKTTFGPPLLPIKYPHKTPPLKNLRGPGPVRVLSVVSLISSSVAYIWPR